jgi:hypothetical protein
VSDFVFGSKPDIKGIPKISDAEQYESMIKEYIVLQSRYDSLLVEAQKMRESLWH